MSERWSSKNQRILREWTSRKIEMCVSSMMYILLQAPETWSALDIDEDDMYNAFTQRRNEPNEDYILIVQGDEIVNEADPEDEDAEDEVVGHRYELYRVDLNSDSEFEQGDAYGEDQDRSKWPTINFDTMDLLDIEALLKKEGVISQNHELIDDLDDASCHEEEDEVLEHWVVDQWLANRLKEHGEVVIEDILGVGPIWGRGCSGQAIYMDSVIFEIAEEQEILEGQKYEWFKDEAKNG